MFSNFTVRNYEVLNLSIIFIDSHLLQRGFLRSNIMVKLKHRSNSVALGNKKKNQGVPEVEQLDDCNWTVVKKQIVTILIPPLPIKGQTTVPIAGDSQIQETARKTKAQLQCPSDISSLKQLVLEKEKSMALSPGQPIPSTKILHLSEPTLTSQKPLSLSHRISSDNSPVHQFKDGKGIGFCSPSKVNRSIMMFDLSSALLNQRMRASHLEKKLQMAGGLENWLVSLGLCRFVKIFQRKSINKFHLANLTMKKLKDMGADAVGPRRKLMHAIDCLCEPHCFRHAQEIIDVNPDATVKAVITSSATQLRSPKKFFNAVPTLLPVPAMKYEGV